jgi:predicted GH43/DUF377 family glycosyl hydrolase
MPSAIGVVKSLLSYAILLTLSACASGGVARIEPSPGLPVFPAFEREPAARPVISSGRAGLPVVAFDPGVFVDDEGYHLFYTTIFCRAKQYPSYSWDPANPAGCDIINSFGSIAYAFSSDLGLTWQFRRTPVVFPSDSGWDAAKIETASVFRLRDTLYLTYSADGRRGGRMLTSRYQIGLAMLPLEGRSVNAAMMDDSTRFARRRDPLLPYDLRAGRFDNNVQEPSVVIRPDGMYLFYVGLGLLLPEEPVEAAGQQIRSVGLGRAVLDDQLNVISRSESAILPDANITEIQYFDGEYHLFGTTSTAGEFHKGARLNHATSPDGVHWSALEPFLDGGVAGVDDWGMMAPTVALARDRVVLFYTAYSTDPGNCFPVPPTGRFGRPVAGGTECLFPTVGRAVAARPPRGAAR